MNRKTLIIILSIIIATLLGVGGYLYFSKKPGSTTPGELFPGEGSPITGAPGEQEEETNVLFTPGKGMALPRLYQLHKTPVAGVAFFESGKGTEAQVFARYIERGLGHIYETDSADYIEDRVVNETRSRLSEALWGRGGQSIVIRSFDEEHEAIKTHVLNLITDASGAIETEEVSLPDYVPFMAVAQDGGDKLFYLENSKESAIGTISNTKSTSYSSIFKSSFTEWIPEFPNQKLITLTTRPSSDTPGYAFFLNPTTKAVTKILSDIKGLTTLTSRDGKYVLYGETSNKMMHLSLYDTTKKTSVSLPIQTLPEKCVWGGTTTLYCAVPTNPKSSNYPDSWYQGIVSFNDSLFKINVADGGSTMVLNPASFGVKNLDMINLTLSSKEDLILFMNKGTGTPWIYRITEDAPLAKPVATSTPPIVTPTPEPTGTAPGADTSLTEGMQKIR